MAKLLAAHDIIIPLQKERIINGAYELSLGGQVFLTGNKPNSVKNLSLGEKIYIEPGQFALLLTKEKVNIPKRNIAFISIKAKMKFQGLINVSGFHVDPGFEGQLLFSVYNAGPSTIPLSEGTAYFPMWFAEINEEQDYYGSHGNQKGIPDDAIRALSQGELASPNALSKRIDEVKHLKTKLEWVVLAIFTLLIGITVKLWTDSRKLEKAVDYGYQKKATEILADSINNTMKVKFDSTLMSLKSAKKDIDTLHPKVDSLTKAKK